MIERLTSVILKWLLIFSTMLGMSLSVVISVEPASIEQKQIGTFTLSMADHDNAHEHDHDFLLDEEHTSNHSHKHNSADHTHVVPGLLSGAHVLETRLSDGAVTVPLHFNRLEIIYNLKRPPRPDSVLATS